VNDQERYNKIISERAEARRLMIEAFERGDTEGVQFYYRLVTRLFIEAMLLEPHPDLTRVLECIRGSISKMDDPSSFLSNLQETLGLAL
jgi:hypothetical protein